MVYFVLQFNTFYYLKSPYVYILCLPQDILLALLCSDTADRDLGVASRWLGTVLKEFLVPPCNAGVYLEIASYQGYRPTHKDVSCCRISIPVIAR